jgi:arylsulfatase
MHVTDWFTTILHAIGLNEPTGRVIDGVDQLDWLTGAVDVSARDGYIYWMGPQMYGVKWRNFKLVLAARKYMQDAADKPPTPRLINLTTDPQEREPVALPHLHAWIATHCTRLISQFEASIHREPAIPVGAPSTASPTQRRTKPTAVAGRISYSLRAAEPRRSLLRAT